MGPNSDSYVVDVLFAMHSPWRGASALARRLRRLTTSALDPYRPELHYMRGPGPKWREKMLKRAAEASMSKKTPRDRQRAVLVSTLH
jgi:hypothetical protein